MGRREKCYERQRQLEARKYPCYGPTSCRSAKGPEYEGDSRPQKRVIQGREGDRNTAYRQKTLSGEFAPFTLFKEGLQ